MAFDEQIFAIQRHGGISRVFAELAAAFTRDPRLDVDLVAMDAPVVNEYLLRDAQVASALAVRPARHWSTAMTRSMLRPRHRGPVDIVHGSFYLSRMLGDYPTSRRVVTVYDMIPELFPDTRRRLDPVTRKHEYVRRADHVIAISASTRDDLLRLYPDITAPVSVVHLGVASIFTPGLPPVPGVPGEYVLHVGMREGYKDAATLIRAFARLANDHPQLHLVLAGGGALTAEERAFIAAAGLTARAHQVSATDAEIPRLYANARVFVFPSRYEGFGLPALEAMASGTPTVLCRSSSLPEVGGDAARYFDPGDDAGLAAQIEEILTDPALAATLSERGREHAAAFTWERTASQTAEVYREVLGR